MMRYESHGRGRCPFFLLKVKWQKECVILWKIHAIRRFGFWHNELYVSFVNRKNVLGIEEAEALPSSGLSIASSHLGLSVRQAIFILNRRKMASVFAIVRTDCFANMMRHSHQTSYLRLYHA
ncbi:hypothetical protein HMPREF1985_00471 [Mitsuokella sp. oral taxon 131 str. W9106]|nr:hypothetical protein HMPREF1985_00471 [Mitsuokella sp. oral taxon 131 str. W9106]